MIAKRKLVAVLAADVAGYTSLMEVAEEATHLRLMELLTSLVEPNIAQYGGRVVKNTGDGFLAAFDTAREAVDCAIKVQRLVADATAVDQTPIAFRIGINLTEAIIESHDIFGDGVNVAARLQASAEPGGIVVTAPVAELLGTQTGLRFTDLGELRLKNMQRPVHAFGVVVGAKVRPPILKFAPLPDNRPSIIVLPFREASGKSMDTWFAEGIIEGIIHVLSGIENLFVISRGTSLAYAAETVDARTIGTQLGVRYALSGIVRRTKDRLRVFTELVDATTGTVLRADRKDGELGDLFEMQDRIATDIVAAIAPTVRGSELARAMRKPPDNLTAYDLLLQALEILYQLRLETFDRARGLLQQAMAHDPGYAPAYSHAATWHMFRIGQGWSKDLVADADEAARCAAAALERDPNDAVALAIQGQMLSFTRRDYDAAFLYLDRAIAASPSCHMAWTLSSATAGWTGNGLRAVEHAMRAMQLSPLDPFAFFTEHMLSQGYYIAGDYEHAIAWGRRAASHNNMLTSNLRTLAAALVAHGDLAAAQEVAQRILSLDPEFGLTRFAARSAMSPQVLESHLPRLRVAGLPD